MRRPTSARQSNALRPTAGAGVLLVALAGCGADEGQLVLCEQALWTVIDAQDPRRVTKREKYEGAPHTIALEYEATNRDGERFTGSIRCRFAGDGFGKDRLELVGLWTDDAGDLSPFAVTYLRSKLGLY